MGPLQPEASRYRMKKLLLTSLLLTLALGQAQPLKGASSEESRKLRMYLRLPYQAPTSKPSTVTKPKPKPSKPKSKPSKPKSKPKPPAAGSSTDSWPIGYPTRYYDGFKIVGGAQEFFDAVVVNLKRMEKETPIFYKMAKKKIAGRGHIHWNKGGSKAFSPLGKITLGQRDWDFHKRHGHDWFLITMIHEFQHCNIPGDEDEGGASWAGHYYGEIMKCRKFFTNYSKRLAVKRGYSNTKWQDQLRRTKAYVNK